MSSDAAPESRWLYRSGAILMLLGLGSGLTTSLVANARMGLSAHLEGALNGVFLIALGSAWASIALPRALRRLVLVLLILGGGCNWAATELAAIWRTSVLTPIIGGGQRGAPLHEAIVSGLLVIVAVASIVAVVLLVAGFWRPQS